MYYLYLLMVELMFTYFMSTEWKTSYKNSDIQEMCGHKWQIFMKTENKIFYPTREEFSDNKEWLLRNSCFPKAPCNTYCLHPIYHSVIAVSII